MVLIVESSFDNPPTCPPTPARLQSLGGGVYNGITLSLCWSVLIFFWSISSEPHNLVPSMNKLGMVVHHHEVESDAERLVYLLQGQGHCELFFLIKLWVFLLFLLNCWSFWSKLSHMVHYKLGWLVRKLDCSVQGQSDSKGSKCQWMFFQPKLFELQTYQTWYGDASSCYKAKKKLVPQIRLKAVFLNHETPNFLKNPLWLLLLAFRFYYCSRFQRLTWIRLMTLRCK